MIRYFIDRQELTHVREICELLNRLKIRIMRDDYSDPRLEFNDCKEKFDHIRNIALSENCEKLANAQFVFCKYFLLFSNLSEFFDMLSKRHYEQSWNKLQDCLDLIKLIGRFAEDRFELEDLYDLLTEYEKLYPYKVFCSSEYVIGKSHCSICGKPMQSLSCAHIRGNIYWGEMAVEIIDKVEEVQAVCLVEHPEDKRCILWPTDDDRTENEKFKRLALFLDLGLPYLQQYSTRSQMETRVKDNLKLAKRNQPCPCGSGRKFKKCCYNDLYYKHEAISVKPRKIVELKLIKPHDNYYPANMGATINAD